MILPDRTSIRALFLGLCVLLGNAYATQTREFSDGRYDILLTPRTPTLLGIIIKLKAEKRYTLSVEIMTDSYLDGKLVDELSLPERCAIINVHRDGKNLVPAGTRLIPGDQVQIEMDSQDIEKLYEPLVSMANIY